MVRPKKGISQATSLAEDLNHLGILVKMLQNRMLILPPDQLEKVMVNNLADAIAKVQSKHVAPPVLCACGNRKSSMDVKQCRKCADAALRRPDKDLHIETLLFQGYQSKEIAKLAHVSLERVAAIRKDLRDDLPTHAEAIQLGKARAAEAKKAGM